MTVDVAGKKPVEAALLAALGAAAGAFVLQVVWFMSPRIILGSEQLHAGMIVAAAVGWLALSALAIRRSRWGWLALIPAPLALMVPIMIGFWMAACSQDTGACP